MFCYSQLWGIPQSWLVRQYVTKEFSWPLGWPTGLLEGGVRRDKMKKDRRREHKRKGNAQKGFYSHRYWSVNRHQAQCAVVQSDCPEKKQSGSDTSRSWSGLAEQWFDDEVSTAIFCVCLLLCKSLEPSLRGSSVTGMCCGKSSSFHQRFEIQNGNYWRHLQSGPLLWISLNSTFAFIVWIHSDQHKSTLFHKPPVRTRESDLKMTCSAHWGGILVMNSLDPSFSVFILLSTAMLLELNPWLYLLWI